MIQRETEKNDRAMVQQVWGKRHWLRLQPIDGPASIEMVDWGTWGELVESQEVVRKYLQVGERQWLAETASWWPSLS